MSSDERSILEEARRHHREHVNAVLRRPGMYTRDEMAEVLLLDAMAAVDGSTERWEAEYAGLREHFFSALGVRGAYRTVLPTESVRAATSSVYAGIAHRCGWLDVDRALSAAEYQRLVAGLGEWVTQDRTLSQVVDRFGVPSLWIGGVNPLRPKTLCYATASPDDELICFHLWNTFANPGTVEGVHPEPVLLAVRHRAGDVPFSFSFTPEGLRRRPTADQQSPLRPTVWIFHGDQARYASAVFEAEEAGLAWAAEHRVTGVLAEYAFGGAYDAAVGEGRFTPSKPHHGTAGHVGAFSPGLQHLHLVDGRRA